MARAISDEEQQLKRRARRRLIGAIVLVTAIVVALPMVLDSEPRPAGQPVSVQIPSPDSGAFTSKIVPLPASPASAPQAPAAREPAGDPVKPPAAAPKAGTAARAEPTKGPLKAAGTGVKPKNGQFVVQVIALADAGRARQMQQKIADSGIQSYTEVVKTQKGDVTRVRAGPFASRKDAEEARDRLKTLGMNGNVTAK
ncbi:MAG TPA: SPOR domain-containing protein [Burkholderiales bacterium]|nr:SPOR domain-containing protein [Burkholderiales bacterium]